ncbi:MAG: hypothetical protein DA405_07790 [Bacteroidetes bacterium]|nr:MAG: hypothetical protein DA405_07790 [Bacteroidota bacterium]
MKLKRIILVVLLVLSLTLVAILFVPKHYDVLPFSPRAGTQYWSLSTGSQIGYFKMEAEGEAKESPIIYLHGGPGGMISDAIIESLRPLSEQGHDIYFYDQIGSGHSSRLADISEYSVQRHQEDLQEIITIINAPQVILYGHSWGSCLAINYLQKQEDRVEKIIITGPGPILPINRAVSTELAPDSLALRIPQFSNAEANAKVYNWRSRWIEKWAYHLNVKLGSDAEVDDFLALLNQELSKSTACFGRKNEKSYPGGSGYYSHIMTLKSFAEQADQRSHLAKLNTPILILRGDCDNQKWGFAKEYLDLFSQAQLRIIKDAGHNPLENQSEYCLALMAEFLVNP